MFIKNIQCNYYFYIENSKFYTYMKVIKKAYEKEIVCPKCGSVLYYVRQDVNFANNEMFIVCPECKKSIGVNIHKNDFTKSNFNVGDWLVSVDDEGVLSTEKIVKIDNNDTNTYIELVNTNGCNIVFPKTELNKSYHHWAINDAKDGDVLTLSYASQNYILIYKELYKNGLETIMSVFCFYSVEEDTYYDGTDSFHLMNTGEVITPATKEQRDTLFTKMKEAGYKWDAENKELTKIISFNEGDWIIDRNSKEVFYVNKVLDETYEVIDIDGQDYRIPFYIVNDNNIYRKWLFLDAKDGDVLATDNYIYIFNGLDNFNKKTINYYCIFDKKDWNLKLVDTKIYNEVLDSIPATKEQRDLLFKKIKDEGYEWDNEKKLRKVYKNSIKWSDEDEIMKVHTLDIIKKYWNSLPDTDYSENEIAKSCYNWLKSLKQ